jgi:hypothetical protein
LKLARLIGRMLLALPMSCLIGVIAWYLWLNEEFMAAKTEYDA